MNNKLKKRKKRNDVLSRYVFSFFSIFPYFTRLSFYPNKTNNLNKKSIFPVKGVGVVVQGPPVLIADFTYQTLKYYVESEVFDSVVFSTTSNLSLKWKKRVEDLGVKVLVNKIEKASHNNIEHQVVNSVKGIKLIKEEKIPYCMKTRSDQRLYKISIVHTLFSLLKLFPVSQGTSLQNRIVSCGLTCKKINYHVGDFLQFGRTEDVLLFWSSSENSKETSSDIPEIIITKNFLNNIGFNCEKTTRSYYSALQKYFIICDHIFLDLFWSKYFHIFINAYHPKKIFTNYGPSDYRSTITFSDWISIYHFDLKEVVDAPESNCDCLADIIKL
jgi:hypothetical protein